MFFHHFAMDFSAASGQDRQCKRNYVILFTALVFGTNSAALTMTAHFQPLDA